MKILLVDDTPTNRKLLRVTLEAEGHTTVEAGDGFQALAVLEREPVDAIISDILMPNMDGFRFCHELRHNERLKHLPFLHYTSTYTSAGDQKLSESLGADRYLTKPVSTPTMLEALREAVSKSAGRKSSTVTSSDPVFVMKEYSQTLVEKLEKRNKELDQSQTDVFRTNEKLMRHAERLDRLNAELEQRVGERTAELDKSNEGLKRKYDENQKFYHTLSHELKTPLTSALEFLSIVMDGLAGPLNQTQLEYIGIARDSCRQLHGCINDLLDASRLETGKLRIEKKTGSLGGLGQRVVKSLEPLAGFKGLILRCHVQPGLPDVPFDGPRIIQVLTNLVNNALKFTPSGGTVTVRIEEDKLQPELLCVSVNDTGQGIPQDELARIFDRLYQIKEGDATNEQGFGLGLYLCRELVEMHGGRICAESGPVNGSTFTFLLPKQPNEKRTTVLVVDDDAGVRDFLKTILERADYVVVPADTGKAALQLTENHRPDVVVLDLRMPDIDGSEVLKELRRRWPSIPVLVLTGFPDGELMNRALECGPFTLLAKTCKPDELVATIQRLKKQEETSFWKMNKHGRNPELVVSPSSAA